MNLEQIFAQNKKNEIKVHITRFWGDGDSAFVKAENKNLLLFFPHYTKYGWHELWKENKLDQLENKKITVVLYLFLIKNEDIKSIKNASKKIEHIQKLEYKIEGEIKEKIAGFENLYVADCGLPVYINSPPRFNPHIGDWISAKGRLDTYLIK